MAVKDCNEMANILATQLIAWDDELAQIIADLSASKRTALATKSWLKTDTDLDKLTWLEWHALELQANSADAELRAIVWAKVLKWEIWEVEAYNELAEQIAKERGSMAQWIELINKIDSTDMADFDTVVRLWWWEVWTTIEDIKSAVADFTAANYSIKQYASFWQQSEVKAVRDMIKWWEITAEEGKKEIDRLRKEAQEKIKKWENPTWLVKLDEEWQAIKKIAWWDKQAAIKARWQYVMAKELLSDWSVDDEILDIFRWVIDTEDLTGPLTLDQIDSYWKDDLAKLLARAYTNTKQLYEDWILREAYKEKLIKLTSWMSVDEKNYKKVKSITNTIKFAEQWATFSSVMEREMAIRSARKLWLDVRHTNWVRIYNDLRNFVKQLDITKEIPSEIEIWWVKMTPSDIIQIIYDITWDKNIIRLVNMWEFTDDAVMWIATKYFFWDKWWAAEKIIALFKRAKQLPKTWDVFTTTMKTITGKNIDEKAKVGFFDFRKWLYIQDELSRDRANFMQQLSDKNKMRIEVWDRVEDLTWKSDEELKSILEKEYKWWYIIVNDVKYRDNKRLADIIYDINNRVFKNEEDKIQILFPRGWMSWNFARENWNLMYRTIDDNIFDNIAWTISIQTLWESRPTREMIATANEAATWKNSDKIRWQPTYKNWAVDSTGRKLTDQQDEYFALSKIRDENGNLLKVYHNTNAKFNIFDLSEARDWVVWVWVYFTPDTNLSKDYWDRVIEAYLDIRKPLVLWIDYYDNFWKYITSDEMLAFVNWLRNVEWFEGEMIERYLDRINRKRYSREDFGYWTRESIMGEAERLGKQREVLDVLTKTTWYDWIALRPWAWYPDEYVAFSPNQIKYVDNLQPTLVDDMRFQLVWPEWIQRMTNAYPEYVARYSEAQKMMEAWASAEEIYSKTWFSISAWWDIEFEIPWTNRFTSTFDKILSWEIPAKVGKTGSVSWAWLAKHIKTVGDLINNPELFAAYPELANRPVNFKKSKKWWWRYSPGTDDFTFNPDSLLDDSHDIIAHEIQHYIQRHEWHKFKVHDDKSPKKITDTINWLYRGIKNNVLKWQQIPDWVASSGAKYPRALYIHEHYNDLMKWIKETEDWKTWAKLYWDELKYWEWIEKDWKAWRTEIFEEIQKWWGDLYYREAWESQSYAVGFREANWDATRWTLPSWQEPFPREMQLMKDAFWNEITWYHYIPSGMEVGFQERYINALTDWSLEDALDVIHEYAMVKHFNIPDDFDFVLDAAPTSIADIFYKQFRTVKWNDKVSDVEKVMEFQRPLWLTYRPTPVLPYYELSETLINKDAGMRLKQFWKWRTVKEIAEAYWIWFEDISVLEPILKIEWIKAYGAYGNWVIYFSELVKESTAPHELFHAIFDMVDKKTYDKILSDWTKLFKMSEDDLHELLANEFAKYFKTWKFTYWDSIKSAAQKETLNEEEKTFVDYVLWFFKKLEKWLWLVDIHQEEVKKLFDNMLNMKYIPQAWEDINAIEALNRYNEQLNNTALTYFWKMLWESWDLNDPEYVSRIQDLLTEKTWVPINKLSEMSPDAVSDLWKVVDTKFTLDIMTAGKYDKQLVNVQTEINRVTNLSDEDLSKELVEVIWSWLTQEAIRGNNNINSIRDAYIDYLTARSEIESLESKWKIIALANWVQAEKLSINDVKNLFTNWNFESVYRQLFIWNEKLSKEDLWAIINSINDTIFDTISIRFAENLVSAWYELPLMNVKSLVYWYLRWNLDLNDKFVQAFFFKNNIPPTVDNLKSITSLMPKEMDFGYTTPRYRRYIDNPTVWDVAVFREVDNPFLQDSYSALATIEWAVNGTLPAWYDRKILEQILDDYNKKMWELVKSGGTFQDAQVLKEQASYALDMFEQDFLLPKYWRFLSPSERKSLIGMKYSLSIWVGWQDYNKVAAELEDIKKRLMNNYDNTIKEVSDANTINRDLLNNIPQEDKRKQKAIEMRRDKLAEDWAVIQQVWNDYLVYDSRVALKNTLKTLPSNIQWLDALKLIWDKTLEKMSNSQVYALLRYIEAAKALAAKSNYAIDLMYKQNPMLAKLDFFRTFKMDAEWIPMALEWDALAWSKFFANNVNTWPIDKKIKTSIINKIKAQFNKSWYLEMNSLKNDKWEIVRKWLVDIVNESIDEHIKDFWLVWKTEKEIDTIKQQMGAVYNNAFNPYTYLHDIPWAWKWWVKEWDIKWWVKSIMKKEYDQAMADINSLDIPWLKDIESNIVIQMENWEKKGLKELWELDIDSWKKDIFWNEPVFVESAERARDFVTPWMSDKQKAKAEIEMKEYRENMINSYASTMQSILNQWQIVSEAESKISASIMSDVRAKLRKYSLTNWIVDTLDAVSWLNEEAARWIKDYLVGTWAQIRAVFSSKTMRWVKDRLEEVQTAYRTYYNTELSKLNSIKVSTEPEKLALDLAKYFKRLEAWLWSLDWTTWCTTDAAINRAFYHIWETFLNIRDTKWIYWMLSAIEQNQLLKFFKFSQSWQLSYVPEFVNKTRELPWIIPDYRDYVSEINSVSHSRFNQIFGTQFNEDDYKKVVQWLSWFTIVWDWIWRFAQRIMNLMNGSNVITRILMSYPWQLLTIPQQGAAYFLKQMWHERQLWVQSLSDIDLVRKEYWVLDWAYNEFMSNFMYPNSVSVDDINPGSFYNRYWIPDVDRVYNTQSIESAWDAIDMYTKVTEYWNSSDKNLWRWIRQLDPYKDNANNIIDWIFSRNFKNIAFAKAIKENDFLQFATAREFKEFMDNPAVSAEIKKRLIERVEAYSWRNFRNILWLWFWWLDRPVFGSTTKNVLYWLMQMLNFRWAWWQNIFKQTWETIISWMRMLSLNMWPEWKDVVARYIATRPEFLNFVWALYNDLMWAWRLSRFQDNGRWPEWDDTHDCLDWIEYIRENMNMTSQRWQGIQSFWPARPIIEMQQSQWDAFRNPTVYKDTYWVWALFNSIGKNFWRQRKPYNWATKALWAFTTDWRDWFSTYVQNEFWKLSFGSLRYMMDEDVNSYWYSYELTWQTWWIPAILMWEAATWWDKTFEYDLDNTKTWETIKEVFDSDLARSDKKVYLWNLWKAATNSSQFLSIWKNFIKAREWDAPSYYTDRDLAWIIQETEAWKEFYNRWYVTPSNWEEAKIFYDSILKNWKYRPGSKEFNKSIAQFEMYWHMNGKETWNPADAEMELWLEHMKYETNEDWSYVWWTNGRKVDADWDRLMKDLWAHWNDQTYCKNLIYAYSINWLNEHSSDPNYQLYIKMLWQWAAARLIETQKDMIIEALNVWAGKWADNKWTETELMNRADKWYLNALYNLWMTTLPWDDKKFFDKLQVLDTDAATEAALLIINDQAKDTATKKRLEKFFETKEDDDWIKSLSLRYQFKQQLLQVWEMSKAMDEWNREKLLAAASNLAHMYKSKDPSGAVTATLIDSIYNRVYQTDSFSNKQKLEVMTELFRDNKDFIQRNAEKMREVMWSKYDEFAKAMNQMLYQWDWQTISILESAQTSWKSSSWTSKSASKLSSAIKSLATSIGWNNYSWWNKSRTGYGSNYDKEWVPVQIKWADLVKELWVKWYVPDVTKIKIKAYNPEVDLSLKKDINRKVKKTSTEKVSTKKQIADIEKKTTKAVSAES